MFGIRRRKLLRKAHKGVENLLTTPAGEIMTDYVVTIGADKSVIDAASVMIGEAVSGLVVEAEGKPIGILTERDFITKVPLSSAVFKLKVKDIMSCMYRGGEKVRKDCAVEAMPPEASLLEAKAILKDKHIRKLVIVDKDGRIAGIVTQTDLSKAIYERVHAVARMDKVPFLVKDVMNPKFQTIDKGKGFTTAKALLTKKNMSSLPVTDKGEVVGIFTEYDVVAQFYDTGGKIDIQTLPEVMKSPVKVIPSDINIFDANMIMLFEKVRRLLVVDDKKVVGFLTQTDLVHSCFEYIDKLKKYLKEHRSIIKEQDLVAMHAKNAIISEYASEHLRAFKLKN